MIWVEGKFQGRSESIAGLGRRRSILDHFADISAENIHNSGSETLPYTANHLPN